MAAVEQFVVRRAERTQARLRIALQGASGGGKTATSLLLARGMVEELKRLGKLPEHLECHIGLLDTERDSAKLYAHLVPFDTVVLEPPYTVERYLAALTALERVGYPVIVVDQITHEWYGEGGILQQVQAIQAKGGNEFTAWKVPSAEHDRFIDRLLATPAHLIATMRSKTEWILEEVEKNGRRVKVPKRIGMAARQREGTEYEFTTVLDLEVGTNAARCLKDRTELFTVGGQVGRMGPDWGARFIGWVYTSTKPEPYLGAEPTAAERAQALADAGIRAVELAPNLPDLILAFDGAQKQLRALARDAGGEVVRVELDRLIAAKDARKALFVPDAVPPEAGAAVSPDELMVLETMLQDGGVPAEEFRAKFAVLRMAVLPAARYEEACSWIVAAAQARGRSVEVPRRPSPRAPEPSLPELMDAKLRAIGNSRGGLFADEPAPPAGHPAFADMDDDLPFTP